MREPREQIFLITQATHSDLAGIGEVSLQYVQRNEKAFPVVYDMVAANCSAIWAAICLHKLDHMR